MYKLLEKSYRFGAVLFLAMLLASASVVIYFRLAFAQEPTPQPTGYFVEVQSLVVPQDITQTPIGTFVVYAKNGKTVIWQENVHLAKYTTDEELETVLDAWANPYIDRYERQQALDDLAKKSKIIGKKLGHKR